MTRIARGQGATLTVATLGSAFGVGLLQVTGFLDAVVQNSPFPDRSQTLGVILQVLALVFIVIAVYVAAVVTSNTVATVVAGRARSIALLRLLGSSARTQRVAIAREGLAVGVAGAVLGGVIGTAVAIGLGGVSIAAGWVDDPGYGFAAPILALPIVGVALTIWLAAWIGSRAVLAVTPLQALRGAEELSSSEVARRPARNVLALLLAVGGGILLVIAIFAGLVSPLAVLIGLVGGIVSFTGIVLGADVVLPPALRLVGRLLGFVSGRTSGRAASRLAAENALRHPQRSSRATIGLVIGVTLLMTFGTAVASFEAMIRAAQEAQPEVYQGTDTLLTSVVTVFSVLIGFSGLIAAVGLVNNLSLSVLQRTRELGLLRALGFSIGQLRRMIVAEAGQLTLTAILLGVVLGGFYGWVGAQSLLGSMTGSPGIVLPATPWLILGIVIVAGVALTMIASAAPTRRATRISPVAALAVE